MRARALCQEAARKRIEELKLLEGEDAEKKPGGLSIEQLTAHTRNWPDEYSKIFSIHIVMFLLI
jgi:hypothetical protein